MKLLYIANARIPTEKAHGVQIIKMGEVFQRLGVQVELLVPFRVQSERMKQVQNLWTHYAVETPFAIRRLPAPDTIRLPGRIPGKIRALLYQLQSLIFSLLALLVTLFQRDSVYYTRHVQPLLVLCLTRWLHRKPIYFEAHELHGKPDGSGLRPVVYRAVMGWMLRQVDGMIVITHGLKRLYAGMGLDERKILVAPDGIESKRLHDVPDKFAARQHLQLPLEKKILCYTGHLFPWKGVYTLAASAQYLPDAVMIYLVGGMEN
ncbi:glycosyltransferase, partial [candidate division KSB3 bacterium]|nr:glycosyltransferase [candidate division KSB3 bacterium]MBD3325386.1 glycosyltransferase [candidate division KSB3 bacterium]